MSKKKKRNSAQHAGKSEGAAPQPEKRSKYIFPALAVGIVLLITVGYFLFWEEKAPKPSPERAKLGKESVGLRENRPTLSPGKFTGKVKQAYEIARTIPEVLDRLYCYCQCGDIGHKSLLSCYVDDHASA